VAGSSASRAAVRDGHTGVKPLAFWTIGLLVVFGVFAVIVNLVRETERVFVVVDSSFPMEGVWNRVAGELDKIDDQRYSEFALATEKMNVHTWGDTLRLGAIRPFAPCGFDEVPTYPEISEADELILITTPGSCSTDQFADWEIILIDPGGS
jgi:hypothetical protein